MILETPRQPLALREISNDPAAALYRRLRAGLCFFLGEQWLLTGEPWQKTDAEAPLPDGFAQALQGSLLVMLVLGFLGWRWTAAWRHEAMPSSPSTGLTFASMFSTRTSWCRSLNSRR